MALEASEECIFDSNFEFDAPRWVNLETEKDQLENEPNCDMYDWWFQEVHPLQSPEMNSPEPKPKKRPLRKSILESSKLSSTSLSGKTSLSSTSSKTSLSCPQRSSGSTESKEDKSGDVGSKSQRDSIKRPRKCWQLNGPTSLSFSPQQLPSLPEDLRPKRGGSNSSTTKTSLPLLPTRVTSDHPTASPLATHSPSKKLGVKNKSLKTARRSCPQKIQKSTQAWNESSTKNQNTNDDIDEELQKIIEEHNRKILNQQSEYDLNGRKIRKTTSPSKTGKDSPHKQAKKENMQPTSTKTNQCLVPDIDDELRELIDQHNKRIWAAQNSEYDLNGRRVRRGNATVVAAPSKPKTDSQTTLTRSKSLRQSMKHETNSKKYTRRSVTHETNTKRKNPSSCKSSIDVISKLNKTAAEPTSQNIQKQPKASTDIENEIQEIITLHNSRLAAKKARK